MAAITKALIGQDVSKDARDECAAHLDTLMALGQAKSQFYAEKINASLLGASQGIYRIFPISTIQSFIYQTKAYTSDDAKNITGIVDNSIKGFVSYDSQSAISTMISGFVNILFGSSEGVESEVIRYCAILEGASMVRLDFAGWSRSVTSTALKSKCDKVSAFVLYRSIVDMSKVTLNDFISVYQWTVKAENPGLSTIDILDKCKEIYYQFNPVNHMVERMSIGENLFTPSIGHSSLDIFTKHVNSL